MASHLKLDMVSDISCPWCLIGQRSLQKAVDNLDTGIEVELEWQPFELNPDMPAEGELLYPHIQNKYGLTQAQVEQNQQVIAARGEALGLAFQIDQQSRIYNTFDAHRLLQWAADQGRQCELKSALFSLYFEQRGNPGKRADLLQAVETSGLERDQAAVILDSDAFADQVRVRESHYRSLGISSVPTLIINGRYSVVGAQPVETFARAMQTVLAEAEDQAPRSDQV